MLKKVRENHLINIFPMADEYNKVKIKDIKSTIGRNYLRGINPESYSSTKNALEKIKLKCTAVDYKKSLLYIRTNDIFSNCGTGQLLNKKCPREISNDLYFSKEEIETQINNHDKQISELAEIAFLILKELKNNNLIEALDLCNDMIEKKGVSIFLLRMISYITNRFQLLHIDNNDILTKIDVLKIKIELAESPFISEVITQLSNLRTSHLAVSKRIHEMKGELSNNWIARFFLRPIPQNFNVFNKTLNSLYSFSLFDSYLYLCLNSTIEESTTIKTTLNQYIIKSYVKLCSVEFQPNLMYTENDSDMSYYYLRECFLFIEQPKALRFLTIHGFYYSDFYNQKNISFFAKKLIGEYFQDISDLNQLRCKEINLCKLNHNRFDPVTCGILENSSALVHLLSKKEGVLNKEEKILFTKLMTFTRDIGEICHPEYLDNIATTSDDFLLKLVAQCLITINKKSQYTEHQLRSTIQEYCIQEFNGNLILLLEHLYKISPAVTEHLILTCNETFLSTLFHLMDRPVDALQVRADMLHWFGELTGEERYIDRAKTLRIDIQINKEKGTIDDSRIYVDPLKFSQWFEDKMVSKFTMSLDNYLISNATTKKIDWNTKANGVGIGYGDEVIDSILLCYKEFCENKVFGIASYLGRRIRHGTFKGTAISELGKLPEKNEYLELFDDKDFEAKFNDWMTQYERMIEDLVNTSLQIKSKRKPNGLITTDIDSILKVNSAKLLVEDILSIYSKRIGVASLPSLLIDYCWRLAEYDLTKIKKLLSEKKSSYAVFSYVPKSSNYVVKKLFSKFTKEVNVLTGQKFGLMASWFNKPSYASPSTDIYLLFNAVISEVKDSVNNFNPKLDVGDRSFQINGGTYYVIYDALYVLIHNAARHGKVNGKINFFVSTDENRNAIKINLMSEISTLEKMEDVEKQIYAALNESDDDAHVVEGKSGIKKLKKLENEGSISSISFTSDESKKNLCFEFYFELNSRGKYNDIDS